MPTIKLSFTRPGGEPINTDAYLDIDKIELGEDRAYISFRIKIPQAHAKLVQLNQVTSGSSRLILEDFIRSNDNILHVGNLRIDKFVLMDLFNRGDFLRRSFLEKIGPQLREVFTIQNDAGENVIINQDYIEFNQKLKFFSGRSISTSPYELTRYTSPVPFISFLGCALKDFFREKETQLAAVPKDLLEFYNKDGLNMMNIGLLFPFLRKCKEYNLPVELTSDYRSVLTAMQTRMNEGFTSLFANHSPSATLVNPVVPGVGLAPIQPLASAAVTNDVVMQAAEGSGNNRYGKS